MFERYNQQARRSIFHARIEASELGLREITSDCLLLGILCEDLDLAGRWLGMPLAEIRVSIVRRAPATGEHVPTNQDLLLTSEAKNVLTHAAVEADRMGHRQIGTVHLFLGLLHEPKTFAAQILQGRGMTLEQVRAGLGESAAPPPLQTEPGVVRDQQVILQLEDGSKTASIAWDNRVPTIGESISLNHASGGGTLYRILDVQWRVHNARKSAHSVDFPLFQIGSVLLIVRQEPA